MRLIIGATGAGKKIPLIFTGIIAVLQINCSSSTEWRGIPDSEFQERSLKLGNDPTNKVQSPERWRTKPIIRQSDSLIQGSSNHERILSLGAGVDEESSLKQGLSKSFKPSSIDKRKSDEQANPETTRSPYVLEIRYDDDNHKRSSFLDLMGAGTRAQEKVPPEVIQVPLAGAVFGHSVPSSAALHSNIGGHGVVFPKARDVTSTPASVSTTASNSSNVLLVNHPSSEATTKALVSHGELRYHPHIPYKPQHNVNESKPENLKAFNVDVFRQYLPGETDASSSTLAPRSSSSPPVKVPKKIVTKISPLFAADALGTNAGSKPFEVSGYKREAEQVQFIDLGALGHDADLKPHSLLEEMRKLIAAHNPKIDSGRSSLVLFHKNKEMMSQGDVQTSHVFPSNQDRIQISTKLELPTNPNQTTANSSPPVRGKPAASSPLAETVGNSLYVQSVTPSSVLGKPNQDVGKASAASIGGVENFSASSGAKSPVHVKFHNKLIPVTAFIDPKSAPLPGVHFVLNPWVYKFPPWFEPLNPPPPGASSNSSDLLQGDIILDLEGLQDSSNGDELVNVRVPSFSRFKDEVVRTILEANLKERSRKAKNIDSNLAKNVNGNSLKSEVTSETHPEKVVSVIGDPKTNVKLASIEHSIDHDLNSNKQLNFHSGEARGIAPDVHHSAYGSSERDSSDYGAGNYHSDNAPNHGGSKSFQGDTSHEDSASYSPYYDGNKSLEKYSENSDPSFRYHPYRGQKNSKFTSNSHEATPYSSGRETHFGEENFESGERFSGDIYHSEENEFEGYQEQNGDEYDGYPSTPVYGTPHYHVSAPYNGGNPGSYEDTDSYDNSEYNQSGERGSSHEIGSYNDEYFRDSKSGTKDPVYTSYYSGGNSDAPEYYSSSEPNPQFETADSSSHYEPNSSDRDNYNENEQHTGEDSPEKYERLALHSTKPMRNPTDSGDSSHNFDSDGLHSRPHSPENQNVPDTGHHRDSSSHFGHSGSHNNYNPNTEVNYFPHVGTVTLKQNPHHHSKLSHSNGGKLGIVNGREIFRDDTTAGKFGMQAVQGNTDYVGTTVGQFLPSSGYRHAVLKPFRPSPPDPTSVPSSILNEHINHSPPSKHLEVNHQGPHSYAYKDKYSSVFVSKPQYLRSIYGPPGDSSNKLAAKHGVSKKLSTPHSTLNSNYVLTPHKYYYDDHRSHPVMSSGHAVTYWVPSKHNFYRSPSRRHDLASSGSSVSNEGLVVGVHPAALEDIRPSPKLVPPAVRISEKNSATPRLSEGLDLLPYINALHRNKKRKNKLNISIPMSYSGTSLRNVPAFVDDTSTHFRKPSSYRRSKEHTSTGINVDIIYGSRKNSGPVSPHLTMKNGGSKQHFSRLIVSEESLHEGEMPSKGSALKPLLLQSPPTVRRVRESLRVSRQGAPSAWYWPEGLQI